MANQDGTIENDLPDLGQNDLDIGAGGKNNVTPPAGTPTDEAAKKAAEEKAAADKAAAEKAAADKAEADRIAATKAGGSGNTEEDSPEAITIGEETYKLDKNGNAIDTTGKVIKTKAEIDTLLAEQAADEPITEAVLKKAGVTLVDDKGQPLKFEDSEDGLVQLGIALGKKFGEDQFQQFIESDPEFKEFVEYKKTGGKLGDFIQKKTESWKAFKLDDGNEQQLLNVVTADLMAAGYSEERAKQTAEMYKETKRLKEFGKEAYDRLVAAEDAEEKERIQTFKQQQENHTKMVTEHWNKVNETITKGDLEGISIPETDKKPFFEYLSVAVDDKGNSKKTIERSKLPLGRLLQLDYLQYKGFNLNELVKLAVKTSNAKTLRQKVKDHNAGAGGGEGIDKNKYQKPNTDAITLDVFDEK
jgi:hypothetical protein